MLFTQILFTRHLTPRIPQKTSKTAEKGRQLLLKAGRVGKKIALDGDKGGQDYELSRFVVS